MFGAARPHSFDKMCFKARTERHARCRPRFQRARSMGDGPAHRDRGRVQWWSKAVGSATGVEARLGCLFAPAEACLQLPNASAPGQQSQKPIGFCASGREYLLVAKNTRLVTGRECESRPQLFSPIIMGCLTSPTGRGIRLEDLEPGCGSTPDHRWQCPLPSHAPSHPVETGLVLPSSRASDPENIGSGWDWVSFHPDLFLRT